MSEAQGSIDSHAPLIGPRSATSLLRGALGGLPTRLSSWFRRSPWWVQVALIYAVSRVVSFLIFAAVARRQGKSMWSGAQPSYGEIIQNWDSLWYHIIFSSGYPQQLPLDGQGRVSQNQWAFYPAFPFFVRAVSWITGAGWELVAPTVAVVSGLVAALLIYRLFHFFASEPHALWGTVFVVFFPVSAIMQVPYAESFNLVFLVAALFAICRHRYWMALPLVLVADLSRPTGSALALFVVLHAARRLWGPGGRGWSGIVARERWGGVCLGVVSVVGAFGWPLLAWAVTGEREAYMRTEAAWRGAVEFIVPWFSMARYLFGPVFGPVAVVALFVVVLACGFSPAVRKIGGDLRLWCASYAFYLFLVLYPQTSTFRLLLPLFPLGLAAAYISRSPAYRYAVLVFFILLQIVWVTWLWRWSASPGGSQFPP